MNHSYDAFLGMNESYVNGEYGSRSVVGQILLGCAVGINMIAGAVGNFMVLAAIFREDRLHSMANYLIGSLAVTDLLVSMLVVPYAGLMSFFEGNEAAWWITNPFTCGVFIFLDVTCCTASILHLCVIAWVRYNMVSKIRVISYQRSFRSIVPTILAIWLSALILSVTPFFTFPAPSENANLSLPGLTIELNATISPVIVERGDRCIVNDNKVYRVVATTLAFYAPLAFILVVYARMARIAWSTVRRKRFLRARKAHRKERSKQLTTPSTVTQKLRRIFETSDKKPKMQTATKSSQADPIEKDSIIQQQGEQIASDKPSNQNYENSLLGHRTEEHIPAVVVTADLAADDQAKPSEPYQSTRHSSMAHRKSPGKIFRRTQSDYKLISHDFNRLYNLVSERTRFQILHQEVSPSLKRSKSNIDLSRTTRQRQVEITHQRWARTSRLSEDLTNQTRFSDSSLSKPNGERTSPRKSELVYRRKQASEFSRATSLTMPRILEDGGEDKTQTQNDTTIRPKPRVLISEINENRGRLSLPNILAPTNVILAPTIPSRESSGGGKVHGIMRDVASTTFRRLLNNKLKRERKIIFTLGMVIGAFVICWFPFFAKELIIPFCESCYLPPGAEIFINWLGYFNSVLNPIIYAYTNRDFNNAFRKMCCSGRGYEMKMPGKSNRFQPKIRRAKPATV